MLIAIPDILKVQSKYNYCQLFLVILGSDQFSNLILYAHTSNSILCGELKKTINPEMNAC